MSQYTAYGEFHLDSLDDLNISQDNVALLNISHIIKNVKGIKLKNAQIPFSYYVINTTNNVLYWQDGDNSVTYPNSTALTYMTTTASSITTSNITQFTATNNYCYTTLSGYPAFTTKFGIVALNSGYAWYASIPPGTYTSSQMAIILASMFQLPKTLVVLWSAGSGYAHNYTINFLQSTGQLAVGVTPTSGSNPLTFQLFFDNVTNPNLINLCDIPLGFRQGYGSYSESAFSANITNGGTGNSPVASGTGTSADTVVQVTSPFPVMLSGPNYLYLRSNLGAVTFSNTISSNANTAGIIAKIPVDRNYQEIIFFENDEPSYFQCDTDIGYGILFWFTLGNDKTNTPLTFNGQPFSLTMSYILKTEETTVTGLTQDGGFTTRSSQRML